MQPTPPPPPPPTQPPLPMPTPPLPPSHLQQQQQLSSDGIEAATILMEDMGFEREKAYMALVAYDGDVQAAVSHLIGSHGDAA